MGEHSLVEIALVVWVLVLKLLVEEEWVHLQPLKRARELLPVHQTQEKVGELGLVYWGSENGRDG
jgi:hypothetical protein